MQYFKPADPRLFVGDCMPFYHDGTFHLYYLQDENHHQALGGLGGHQWAHASTTDLVHWTHHPMAIPISADWECSICTGSTFYHAGTFYGFYATRTRDKSEHLSLAVSADGIHFIKTEPNPFASPPPGYRSDFRDPFAFYDEATGLFHLLVTAYLDNYPVPDRGGCLAHLVSRDLRHWEMHEPFLIPGLPGAPECSDYFRWHDWYYLIFSNGGVARYRMSRNPFGPWLRPPVDTLDGPATRVMKTAPFTGDRRLGVAFLGTRANNQDDGHYQYAGNAVFREILQHEDGTLWTTFPPEMVPATGDPLPRAPQPIKTGVTFDANSVRLEAPQGLGVCALAGIPRNARITAQIVPQQPSAEFGCRLRATDLLDSGYALAFSPYEAQAQLHDQALTAVHGLGQPFTLEVILWEDIIDVCIAGQRTIINRCPAQQGERLLLYARNADVTWRDIEVRPIL